ncbi:MAG: hypothetical protein JWO80_4522 [Bryobacterales bacterium]|nr:hypothetical protein [Bryobacterales bacterium]
MRQRTVAELLGLTLLALVFALNVYRAAVQSCTIDEAFTYNEFASKPIAQILTLPYDANNQVLHTILCRWVMKFFGVSELSLRIPSLLGGLLFLTMCYRLCRLYFGNGWLFLVTFSALALNPFTLDYLSVARGYGLAAGLLLVAIDQLSRHLLEPEWNGRRLTRASFALGLSVAANLTFAVPALAMALVFLHLEMWERRRLRFWNAVNQFILPGAVAAAVILLLPLIRATRDNFYFGSPTIQESVLSLATPALFHHQTALAAFGAWLLPALPALLAIAAIMVLGSLLKGGTFPRKMPLLMTGGTLALSFAILAGAHWATGMLYPHSRTGLYLVVLFTLASGSAVLLWGTPVRVAAAAVAAPVLILFAAQLTTGPYNMWVFDSGTKAIVNLIRSDMGTGTGNVHVSTSQFLQPSLNFYRRRYHLDRLMRLHGDAIDRPADYYILLPEDSAVIAARHLTVVYRDPVSTQILAKPQVKH